MSNDCSCMLAQPARDQWKKAPQTILWRSGLVKCRVVLDVDFMDYTLFGHIVLVTHCYPGSMQTSQAT